jgi:FlaA1/EpsC-like NDP-sugar epimerase
VVPSPRLIEPFGRKATAIVGFPGPLCGGRDYVLRQSEERRDEGTAHESDPRSMTERKQTYRMDVHAGKAGTARLGVKFASDLAVWTLAAVIAFQLRVPNRWIEFVHLIAWYALVGVLVKVPLIVGFGLYRQVWRRVTVEDLYRLALVVAIGSAVMFAAGLIRYEGGSPFPRTVPVIEGLIALLAMVGVRLGARFRKSRRGRPRHSAVRDTARRVLLAGAGEAGTDVGWEIRRRPECGFTVVGFLDDDPRKAQLSIAGKKVLGRIEDLPRVVADHEIENVFITLPSAGGRITRQIVELARLADVECRILPGITQVLSGDTNLAGIRVVQVEDLLRRKPIELDLPVSYIKDRTVLVTGAGGSIGSELVRQAALFEPANVILFGHGENALHQLHQELQVSMPNLRATIVIGDVRDRAKIDYVMRKFEPSVVFHAAAHKHVPLMEEDPDEAVLNNVGGTRNLAEAALGWGVDRLVNVSTDKAVRPVSILGATKCLAELVVRMAAEQARLGQSFVSVRFGNVLGSRGSVVRVFEDQIRRGGPVTVTDPEMTRYFMTIPEASRLVIQAGAMGQNGAVCVLNMGTPVRIVDLARDMIRLAGADEDEIEVVFTSRRAGEKPHEELFADGEELRPTRSEHIVIASPGSPIAERTRVEVDRLIGAAEHRDWLELRRLLRALVPGFGSVQTPPTAGADRPIASSQVG